MIKFILVDIILFAFVIFILIALVMILVAILQQLKKDKEVKKDGDTNP